MDITPFERRHVVQVVIPETSMHKTSEVAERPKLYLQVQRKLESSRIQGQNRQDPASRASGSGEDSGESSRAIDCMSKDFRREIPDSQAPSSSPLGEKGQDTCATMNQVTDQVSPLLPSPTSISSNQATMDLVSNDELLDELSVAFEPSKKPNTISSHSLAAGNGPLNRINTRTHRHQRNLVERPRKKAVANSFSPATSYFEDLSEDELSFL